MYSVQVAVRIRPLRPEELENTSKPCVCVLSKQKSIVLNSNVDSKAKHGELNYLSPRKPRRISKIPRTPERLDASGGGCSYTSPRAYTFDYCFDQDASQEDIFKQVGQNTLDNAFAGYNASVFAYGQTGSGKTYTMLGAKQKEGLIPRICRELLLRMAKEKVEGNKCELSASYLEIYNENCIDLLREGSASNLKVREHPTEGAFVEDLTVKRVSNSADVENLLQTGQALRRVAQTKMNVKSSRSHAIFTVYFSKQTTDGEMVTSKVNLVDLAGSERLDYSRAANCRMKESANINTSLHQLGRVISTLSERSEVSDGGNSENVPPNTPVSKAKRKRPKSVVPYRDSLLTWLLKPSLGGNSKTTMLVTVSPNIQNYEETVTSLRYASMCKKIRNKVAVNRKTPKIESFDKLKAELERLREAGKRMNRALTMPELDNFHESIVKGTLCEILTAIEYEDMLESQKDTFEKGFAKQSSRIIQIEEELARYTHENVELKSELNLLHQLNNSLKQRLVEATGEFQKKSTSLKLELEDANEKHTREMMAQRRETEKAAVGFREQIRSLQDSISQLKHEASQAKKQLSIAESKVTATEGTLKDFEMSIKTLREDASSKEIRAQAKYEALKAEELRLNRLVFDNESVYEMTLQNLTEEKKKFEQQVIGLQFKIKQIKKSSSAEREKLSEQNRRLTSAFTTRIQENKEKLKVKQQRIIQLEETIKALSENNNEMKNAALTAERSTKFLAGIEAQLRRKTE